MGKHILVIDDEKPVRDSFLLALDETGFIVDTAVSGEQGLEKLKETSFDLIFLDLKMPGMSGVDTLREIRKFNQRLPVYIVTAFSREFFDDLSELKSQGYDFELMHKPLGREDIISITESILSGPRLMP
jgi:DNA-binding response OmpR family regulator